MSRSSLATAYFLWVTTCTYAQSPSTPLLSAPTGAVVCRMEYEEVVLHENTTSALPVLGILPCDAHVIIVGQQQGWYRVLTNDGKEGFVRRTFIATRSSGSAGADSKGIQLSPPLAAGEGLGAAIPVPDSVEIYAEKSETTYAIWAAENVRDSLLDPTSFTLLEAVAARKRRKDGTEEYHGCIRFVGANVVGGRLQQWSTYTVDRKGRLTLSKDSDTGCYISNKEARRDVTNDVRQALSREPQQ